MLKRKREAESIYQKNKKREAESSTTQGCDSASSSFLVSEGDYEVFLSFRGPDTRKTFTNHLYNALVSRGIRTFIDDEELRIGEEIAHGLRSAIHQSKIAIPIFSQGYASSKWCLRELAEIVECMIQKDQRQMTVMPVFYHVDPSNVRYQIGSYEEAFRKHEMRYGHETEGWKKAMKEVADLKGWDVENTCDGHEGELIKLIVKEVWSELRKSPLIVSDTLVGIDSHREEMMKLLKIKSKDIRIVVGIHGLGGIGKTTIARSVYNAVYHEFDGCSFIADARETFRMNGPVHLQSQLLGSILNLEDPKITSAGHGISMIRQRLPNKRVLIVFDDVDFDLKAIIGKHDWLSFGSRIIITTRDKQILSVFGVDETYEPREMDSKHCLQLFCLHAFKRDQPPEHFLDLSKEVVKTTGGLPLALEVIGSSLCDIEESSTWKEMAEKLKKIPHHDVLKKLQISYDGLDRVEKKMFLDIACFFIGMDKNIVNYICEACELFPEIGFKSLCRKSLVKIGEKNELRMHDQLRDLGREIVCRENPDHPGERSRLWLEQDVMDTLSTQTGTSKVEGLCINFSKQNNQRLMSEGFSEMTKLRLLNLDYTSVSGNFMHSFSEIRWLSWKGRHNLQFTPTNPGKLAVLDLSCGEITESWRGWSNIKVAKNLKVLDLSYNSELHQTPNLSENLELVELILRGCENLAVIDNSIGHLKSLVVLNMRWCRSLEKLSTSICDLRSLKRLDISGCKKISQLPEELCRLKALMELLIDFTPIRRLPNSIGDLRNLKTLSADSCRIQEGGIPNDIGRLSSLEYLNLGGNQFRTLPATVSSLSLLQNLSLKGCGTLQSLPQLSYLTNLWNLDLDSCESLMELPITMDALTRLKFLTLSGCTALRYISHLPSGLTRLFINNCENVREIGSLDGLHSLQTFEISSCPSLKKISNLRGMRNLESFELLHCQGLEEFQSFEELASLRTLQIASCLSLKKFLNLRGLGNLESFELYNCPTLEEFQSFEELDSLRTFQIVSCYSLKKFPNLRGLKNLESFKLFNCPKLEEFQSFEELDSLRTFQIDSCNWKKISNMRGLRNLESFKLFNCPKLEEFQSFEELESLRTFQIDSCDSLKKFPNMRGLRNLESFKLFNCPKLEEFQSFEELDSLQTFQIVSCDSLKKFPNMRGLKSLKSFNFIKCPKLEEFESLEELDSLQKFEITGWDSLKKIPNLRGLRNLESFIVSNCPKVENFGSLEGLDSLGTFQIQSSSTLSKLPNLRGLKKLRKLILDDVGLAEIECLQELYSLEELKLERCQSLRKIQLPQKLRRLYIGSELTEIEGLADLESMEVIEIIGTPSVLPDVLTLKNLKVLRLCYFNHVERLPELSNLNKLEDLRIEDCRKLIEVPAVDRFESLEILGVIRCYSLEILPDLSNLTKLQTLCIGDCQKLTEIQGVDRLEILEDLCIDKCISIETLPSLSRLRKLKSLSAVDCKKLTMIEGLDELESVQLDIHGCTSMEIPSLWRKHKFGTFNFYGLY